MRYLAKITTTFALALVFSAGMAFGQETETINNNSTTTNQNGSNNEADIEHVGGENASYVEQIGDNNSATATGIKSLSGESSTTSQTQVGNKNEAFVSVNQAREFGGNITSEQVQEGNRNVARVTDAGLGSEITQKQFGNDNVALSLQGMNGKPNATLYQYQEGSNNAAKVLGPGGGREDISQVQVGDNNRSVIKEFQSYPGQPSTVDVRQEGNSNTADAKFGGRSNNFEVLQLGSRNTATADFNSSTSPCCSMNSFDATQIGNDNTATYSHSSLSVE